MWCTATCGTNCKRHIVCGCVCRRLISDCIFHFQWNGQCIFVERNSLCPVNASRNCETTSNWCEHASFVSQIKWIWFERSIFVGCNNGWMWVCRCRTTEVIWWITSDRMASQEYVSTSEPSKPTTAPHQIPCKTTRPRRAVSSCYHIL